MNFLDDWNKKNKQTQKKAGVQSASLPAAQKAELKTPLTLTKSGVVMADGKGGGKLITPALGNKAAQTPLVKPMAAQRSGQLVNTGTMISDTGSNKRQAPLTLTKSGVVMADGKGGGKLITPTLGNKAAQTPVVKPVAARKSGQLVNTGTMLSDTGSNKRQVPAVTMPKGKAQRTVDDLPDIAAFGAGAYGADKKPLQGFLARAGKTVSGGAKGSLAGNMDAMGVAYQAGQGGRTQRNTEELRDAQWAVARAKYAYDTDRSPAAKSELDNALTKMRAFATVLGDGAYEQALDAAYDAAARFGTADLNELYNSLGNVQPAQGTGVQQRAGEAARDLAADVQESANRDIEAAKTGVSKFWQNAIDAGASMTQSGIDAAASAILGLRPTRLNGGYALMGNVVEKRLPGAMIPFATRAFGGAAMEAREGGGDLAEQIAYGAGIGSVEVATELISNVALPFAKAYGGGALDDVVQRGIQKAVSKLGKTEAGKRALNAVLQMTASGAGEGFEELVAQWAEWQMPRIYGGDVESVEDNLADSLQSFIIGGMSGVAGSLVSPDTYRYKGGETSTAEEGQGTAYRGVVPQNIENPRVGRLEMSSAPYNPTGTDISTIYGNRYRNQVKENAIRRLGIADGKPAYLAASNITKDGREYYVDVTKASLNKMLYTGEHEMLPLSRVLLVDNLEKAIDGSYWAESNGDRKGRDQINGFDTLRTSFYIDGVPYYADIKVKVVTQGRGSDPQNVAYFLEPEEITSIKRMDTPSPTGGRPAPNIVFRDNVSIPDPSVSQNIQGVNTQDMRSGAEYARLPRLVDANGMDAAQRTAWRQALAQMPREKQMQFEMAADIARRFGAVVQARTMADGVQGSYQDGVISIATTAVDPVRQVLIHELTHHMESSGLYSRFSDAALQFVAEDMGADVDTLRRAVMADYARAGVALDEDGATREIVAKFAEEKLFTDEETVRRLLARDRNLFQRVYDWIRDTVAKLQGTREQRRLIDAQNLYERALRQAADGTQDSGAQLLYAGENARTADLDALTRAAQMEADGTDARTIRRETGWFRGMDGKWRFEIDDSGMEYRRDGDARLMEESGYRRLQELTDKWAQNAQDQGEPLTAEELAESEKLESEYYDRAWSEKYELADFLRHSDLFEAYPALRHTSVVFKETMPGIGGYYDKTMDAIVLSKDLIGSPERTLVHEIQHVIQGTEEFAGGSSPNYWKYKNKDGQGYVSDRRFAEAENRMHEAMDAMPPAVQETVRQINRAKLAQDWDEVLRLEESLYNGPYADMYSDYTQADFDRRARTDYFKNANTLELYRNTAGEIEARDAANRRGYTLEQRRQLSPDLGNEATVFADGGVGYEIQTIGGETMPVIDTQNDTRNYATAEAYLKTLVNAEHPFSTILVDAQPVYVGKDLPGEYKSSEYTKTMKPALRTIKMQAATNLDEMLLLAENGEWRKNVKPKHSKAAQNGWYRYETQFAVPVLNAKKAIDHYTVYGGTLLIRNDADGKSYLYDLLDVEKKKVISKTPFSAETHSEVTSPKPSANSIYASDGNVNTDRAAARKAAQLATIERNNPFDPELGAHTWIRSAEDILTYREAIDSFGGVDDVTPDFRASDVQRALDSGYMTVYSSYPIELGTFVTPSRMEAQNYAGDGRVYSKRVPLDDVAWLDEVQGQYTGPVAQEQLSTGRSIEEMAGEDADMPETLRRIGVAPFGAAADYAGVENLARQISGNEKARRQMKKAVSKVPATEKERLFARQLADGTISWEDVPQTVDRSTVELLADYYRTMDTGTETQLLRDRRNLIFEREEAKMPSLLGMDVRYDEGGLRESGKSSGRVARQVSTLRRNLQTPARVCATEWGTQHGRRVYETLFYPVTENNGRQIDWVNSMLDRVRTFQGKDGKARELNREERDLVQRLVETRAAEDRVKRFGKQYAPAAENVRNGEAVEDAARTFGIDKSQQEYQDLQNYAAYLDAQKRVKDTAGVDAAIVDKAVKAYSTLYQELYEGINTFLTAHGYKPIGFIEGYAPHMQPETAKTAFSKALKMLGLDDTAMMLPTSISGMTADLKPYKQYDPFFQTRNGDKTEYDITKGFENYVYYLGNIFYHTDDIMRIRTAAKYIRKTYTSEEASEQISWAENARNFDDAAIEDFLRFNGIIKKGTQLGAGEAKIILNDYIDGLYEQIGDVSRYSEMVKYLDNYANRLAGKQNMMDRGAEAAAGRRSLNWVNSLLGKYGGAKLAFNFSSALNQTSQLPMVMVENGEWTTARAIRDFFTKSRSDFVQHSNFLKGKKGVDWILGPETGWEKFKEAGFSMTEAVDSFTSYVAVRSKYLKEIRLGASDAEAIRAADEYGRNVMGSRARGEKPMLFDTKNPFWQIATRFQLEAMNSWEHITRDLPAEIRQTAKKKGKVAATGQLAGRAVRYTLAAFLINCGIGALSGGSPVPYDILGSAAEAVGAAMGMTKNQAIATMLDGVLEAVFDQRLFGTDEPEDDEEKDWWAALESLFGNAANDVPILGRAAALAGIGDQTLPTADFSKVGDLVDSARNNGILTADTLDKALTAGGEFLYGGNQLRKTVQGGMAAAQGGVYSKGKLRYQVERTPWNVGKALLFGRGALDETEEYYAEKLKTFSEKQTAAWEKMQEAGEPARTVEEQRQRAKEGYDLIRQLSSIEKENDDDNRAALQRQALRESDVSDEAKAVVWYEMMASEKDQKTMDALKDADMGEVASVLMDMKDRRKDSQKLEIIMSSSLTDDQKGTLYLQTLAGDEDKEKVAVLKDAGMDAYQYLTYKTAISGLSGRTEKLYAIHTLDLSDYQKDALYYLNGWSKKTHDDVPWLQGVSAEAAANRLALIVAHRESQPVEEPKWQQDLEGFLGTGTNGNPFTRARLQRETSQTNPFTRARIQANINQILYSGEQQNAAQDNPFTRARLQRETAQQTNPFLRGRG